MRDRQIMVWVLKSWYIQYQKKMDCQEKHKKLWKVCYVLVYLCHVVILCHKDVFASERKSVVFLMMLTNIAVVSWSMHSRSSWYYAYECNLLVFYRYYGMDYMDLWFSGLLYPYFDCKHTERQVTSAYDHVCIRSARVLACQRHSITGFLHLTTKLEIYLSGQS